jgi:predicted RNase H-like nuclease (RuvC/YqgF family)
MNEDDNDDESLQPGDRRENETEEEAKTRKRKERLEQNRISARESRKRKKTMIEELQRTVITLSRENKDLNVRNESLRRQLMEIGSKVSCVWKKAMIARHLHRFVCVSAFVVTKPGLVTGLARHRVPTSNYDPLT